MLQLSVDAARLYLLPVKLVVGIIFVIFSVQFRRKEYILNQIFGWAFISWAAYMLIDSFVFAFAPLSPLIYYICRGLWVIQLFALVFYAFFIFNAVKVIKYGEWIFEKKKELFFEIGVTILVALLLAINSPLTILDANKHRVDPNTLPVDFPVSVSEGFTTLGMIISIFPFVIYFISAYFMIRTAQKTEDPRAKGRMYLLLIGILMIPVGLIYFLLRGIFFPIYTFPVSLVGQLFYMSVPFLVFLALRKTDGEKKSN
jgi:hypothetical protein